MLRASIAASIPLLALLVLIGYSGNLSYSFQFDDIDLLVSGPMRHGSIGDVLAWQVARALPNASLRWNQMLGGYDPIGYHLFNNGLHFCVGLVLMMMMYRFAKAVWGEHHQVEILCIAVLSTFLFVAHPLQVQAVTYIVQRQASMAAFFYLTAMGAYLWFRQSKSRPYRLVALSLAFTAAACAFLSKQNTATLPAAILLLEIALVPRAAWSVRRRWSLGGATAALLLGGLILVFSVDLTAVATNTDNVTPWQYFLTQTVVLWRYVGLFLIPHGFMLIHEAPVKTGVDWQVSLAFLGHVMMVGLSWWLWARARFFSVMILLFYLTHAIESSFIPIANRMFEHRMYLPSVSLCGAIAGLLVLAVRKVMPHLLQARREVTWNLARVFVLFLLTLPLAELTNARNQAWESPYTLWQDNYRKNPTDARVMMNYASALMDRGQYDEALPVLIALQESERSTDRMTANLIVSLAHLERVDEALALAEESLRMIPESQSLRLAVSRVYLMTARYREAQEVLLKLRDEFKGFFGHKLGRRIAVALAYSHIMLAEYDQAEALLSRVVVEFPENSRFKLYLGYVFEQKAKWDEAGGIYKDIYHARVDDPYFRFLMGWLALQRNGNEMALQLLTEAYNSQSGSVLFATAVYTAKRILGQEEAAARFFQDNQKTLCRSEEECQRLAAYSIEQLRYSTQTLSFSGHKIPALR